LADFLNISQDKLESVVDKLRQLYQIQNSKIVLSPKLLQQTKEDSIPPAVVYMQALIDSDRLQHTSLSDKNLLELSNAVNPDTIKILNQMMKEDTKQYEETIDQSLQNDLDVEVNVNKTYFICPKKDLNTWLDIFSRLDEQNIPKGILTYDDKKVRLENFASLHSGDHKQLSDSIQEVMPHTPNRVDYSSFIGGKINDSMMRGYRKHVIGEEYLNHDLVLKKQDDEEGLVVA